MTDIGMGPLILVIDDDEAIRSSLEEVLTSDDYQVLTAKNGEEGLSLALTRLPDLILLDLMMPVMNGYEFLERKQRDPMISKIPVVILSAGVAKDPSAKDIPKIRKPPDLGELFAAVAANVKRSA
jgi:CheY-like chemotaxis protein